MREILYRGKRIDNGEWVYGGIYVNGKDHYIVTREKYVPDTRDWDEAEYYEKNPKYKPNHIKVVAETVTEFTGLCDKNGKQIFDGDVLLTDGWEKNIVVYDRIGWDSGVGLTGFTSVSIDDWQDWSYGTDYETKERFAVCDRCIDLRNIEVIGNKYDNPELLVVKEDNEEDD